MAEVGLPDPCSPRFWFVGWEKNWWGMELVACGKEHQRFFDDVAGRFLFHADRDAEMLVNSGWRMETSQVGFHVLPRNNDEMQENDILWGVVNRGSFGTELEEVCCRKMCAVVIPKKLWSFLRAVTLEEMRSSILDILCDVVSHDEIHGERHR